jgi:hypothetical protein
MLTMTAACAAMALSAVALGVTAKAQAIDDSTYQTKSDKDRIVCATYRCDRYNEHRCVRISDWIIRGASDSSFRHSAPYHHARDFEVRLRCVNDGQDCVKIACDTDEGKCRPLPTQTDE